MISLLPGFSHPVAAACDHEVPEVLRGRPANLGSARRSGPVFRRPFESPPATDTLPWDPDRTIPASLEFRPDEIPTAAPSISISAVPGPGPNKFDVHRSVLVGADPEIGRASCRE